MDTKILQAQIMVSPDHNYSFPHDFYKNQLHRQLVDFIVAEGIAEFDFSDPLIKRVTLGVIVPKKAVK
jgi:hypothetical protein